MHAAQLWGSSDHGGSGSGGGLAPPIPVQETKVDNPPIATSLSEHVLHQLHTLTQSVSHQEEERQQQQRQRGEHGETNRCVDERKASPPPPPPTIAHNTAFYQQQILGAPPPGTTWMPSVSSLEEEEGGGRIAGDSALTHCRSISDHKKEEEKEEEDEGPNIHQLPFSLDTFFADDPILVGDNIPTNLEHAQYLDHMQNIDPELAPVLHDFSTEARRLGQGDFPPPSIDVPPWFESPAHMRTAIDSERETALMPSSTYDWTPPPSVQHFHHQCHGTSDDRTASLADMFQHVVVTPLPLWVWVVLFLLLFVAVLPSSSSKSTLLPPPPPQPNVPSSSGGGDRRS